MPKGKRRKGAEKTNLLECRERKVGFTGKTDKQGTKKEAWDQVGKRPDCGEYKSAEELRERKLEGYNNWTGEVKVES